MGAQRYSIQESRRTPWTRRIFEILSDGQVHDQEVVMAACLRLVSPGRAWRRGEKLRIHQTKYNDRAAGRDDGTVKQRRPRQTDPTLTGARSIVWDSLSSQIRTGNIIRVGENGVQLDPSYAAIHYGKQHPSTKGDAMIEPDFQPNKADMQMEAGAAAIFSLPGLEKVALCATGMTGNRAAGEQSLALVLDENLCRVILEALQKLVTDDSE